MDYWSINKFLEQITTCLTLFLERRLPLLDEAGWWQTTVIDILSYQQQAIVRQHGKTSLSQLDLAALLRILDKNWFRLSEHYSFAPEARHFTKEMQTIRNRWAHMGSERMAPDDFYRDLDTMRRFAKSLGANDILLQEIQEAKNELNTRVQTVSDPVVMSHTISSIPTPCAAKFKVPELVALKSSPDRFGPVMEVKPAADASTENKYLVFFGGKSQEYYESQLCRKIETPTTKLLDRDLFHAHLSAIQILYPALSTLYSLHAARIDFIPYQFRPVLRFIRSDRPRLLIADGVGVGKTIEAGLILRELQARKDVRSVLIICPRPLVTERKWVSEMKRFDEEFTQLNGAELRYCIDEMSKEGYWPARHLKTIVPYSLLDSKLFSGKSGKTGLLHLDPPPRFDLVIVDEAHHIRNPETANHQIVRFFCENAEAVVFLTATPIQMRSDDLFVLLNVLRPDLVIDQESFEYMSEPNPHINKAVSEMRAQNPDWEKRADESLQKAVATPWGETLLLPNPEFKQIRNALHQRNISDEERVQMITDTESLHSFAGIINRTRRRDIGNFTVRKSEAVEVAFTETQQELHDQLLQIQAEILFSLHGARRVKFLMSTIRRQASSCLFGLVPFLEDILTRHLDEFEWNELDDTESVPDEKTISSIESRIHEILEKAKQCLCTKDTKLETLLKIVKEKQDLPNNRVMLFSSFKHTLYYLRDHLQQTEIRIGLVHGGTPDRERVSLRKRFEKDRSENDAIDMLLFSEVGCEGLDYQFCDCMINYDLPWNPMRIEQRIGRIDRNGQQSESVAIINLITPGTVDADIYERCLLRIGVFENSLGDCEEILGEITAELKEIAENFSLTEQERQKQLEQLADNKIMLIQEQNALEQKEVELFGVRLPESQMNKEIDNASSFWLTPESLQLLVNMYFQKRISKSLLTSPVDRHPKKLILSQENRSMIFEDFKKIPRNSDRVHRSWEDWLKGGNPGLNVTFNAECARDNHGITFFTPLHPLVKQAAAAFETTDEVVANLTVSDDLLPAGDYEFIIYQWRYRGVRENVVLQPVSTSEEISKNLVRLLERAVNRTENGSVPEFQQMKELENNHFKLWKAAKEKHRQRTNELVAFRRQSLTRSHEARIKILEEQLRQNNNIKIEIMKKSQIETAHADFARRLQEVDNAAEKADILYKPVAKGVLHISTGDF